MITSKYDARSVPIDIDTVRFCGSDAGPNGRIAVIEELHGAAGIAPVHVLGQAVASIRAQLSRPLNRSGADIDAGAAYVDGLTR